MNILLNFFSAGIVFRRQKLTSTDVRFRRIKDGHCVCSFHGVFDAFYLYILILQQDTARFPEVKAWLYNR